MQDMLGNLGVSDKAIDVIMVIMTVFMALTGLTFVGLFVEESIAGTPISPIVYIIISSISTTLLAFLSSLHGSKVANGASTNTAKTILAAQSQPLPKQNGGTPAP
jgi:hypothetical protein